MQLRPQHRPGDRRASIVSGHVSPGSADRAVVQPAPNTTVTVPGVATIVLNRQIRGTDGTLTVDAIYVSLLGRAQTVTLGASVCNAASLAPVPVLPGMALPIGLGGLTVLMLGGVGYQFSRRRRRRRGRGLTGSAVAGAWREPVPATGMSAAIGHVSADSPAGAPVIRSLAVPSPNGQGSAASRSLSPSSPISCRPRSPISGPGWTR